MITVFEGNIIHTKSLKDFLLYTNGFVAVNEHGKIVGVGDNYSSWVSSKADLGSNVEMVKLSKSQFIMPGFIDCHIHAPQVAQIGLGLDMPLLDWLNTYTFPLEAKFADQDFATQVYKKVVM